MADKDISTPRYSTGEKKYVGKRVVEWKDVPDEPVYISDFDDERPDQCWWPVVILEFHEDIVKNVMGLRLDQNLYLICIYQVLDKEIVAWSIPCSQQRTLDAVKVAKTRVRTKKIFLERNVPPCSS